MKYLFNSANILRGAVLTALGIVPSQAVYQSDVSRTGGGSVRLTGDYTGQDDAEFEVEILNDDLGGASPQLSEPVFTGIGNGVMSGLLASADVDAQDIVVRLKDLGTRTRNAYVPFQGVTLRAAATGAAGNALTIAVTSSLTRTPTNYALLAPLQAGVNEYSGQEWDFGAAVLDPEGAIPSSAPRISFGDDPQVYRQYKVFRDGKYVYSFSPVPVRDVPADARVKIVTGTHTVTVTNTTGSTAAAFLVSHAYALNALVQPATPNGHYYKVTVAGTSDITEPTWPTNGSTVVSGTATFLDMGAFAQAYTSITTLYSLLAAIEADADAFVEVDGPVVNDALPGGMGVTEMSIRTGSYAASVNPDGSLFVREADIGLVVDDSAPTETLTIRCTSAEVPGDEAWSVEGTVSGALPAAETGVPYDEGNYAFTIPEITLPADAPVATKSAVLDLLSRGAGEDVPIMCVQDFLLGVEAGVKQYVYVWRGRGGDCSCDDLPLEGGPRDDLLGIETEDNTVSEIPTDLQGPLGDLYDWLSDYTKSQIDLDAGTGDYSGLLTVDRVEVEAAKRVAQIFHSALRHAFDERDDTISSDALTDWGSALTDMQAIFATLNTLDGKSVWQVNGVINGTTANNLPDAFYQQFRDRMNSFLVVAGVEPDFDEAARIGNSVWRDEGGSAWFESQDGLLPIQPGYYYHSARLNDAGTPYSTREFGIGITIGCGDSLQVGDRLIITINAKGNVRATYQQGDEFVVQTILGAPLQLGGGQTGTDTLTWSVRGTEQIFPDYSLSLLSPNAYDTGASVATFQTTHAFALGAQVLPITPNGHWYKCTVAGTSAGSSPTWPTNGSTVVTGTATFKDMGLYYGLAFTITPGGVDFALGDQFTISAEGGQFQWRKDGGAWTGPVQIAGTVSLSDGLSAEFVSGAAPSFVDGDTWTFTAEAINGPDKAVHPTDGEMVWTGSLSLTVAPTDPEEPAALYILWHDIPDDAVITLQGSDDDFATTPLVETVTWAARSIVHVIVAPDEYAKYRVLVDKGGRAQWIFLGDPLELAIRSGVTELGRLTKRVRLPRAMATRATGGTVTHEALSQASVDAFLDALADATENDEGRFGIVPNDAEPAEAGIVSFDDESVELTDELGFQPRDTANRWMGLSLDLEPV